ncbi:MAG: hypothetical protein HC917_28720 [Richelia sp. SM2_1_7]|nr:hypothetical protein [Richelia sp. SM2_1_7]
MKKDIPTMAQTRAEIIILDEWVELTWSGTNVPYYMALGYEYTGRHQKFLCKVGDLLPTSRSLVNVMCPVCEEERLVLFAPLSRVKHTL